MIREELAAAGWRPDRPLLSVEETAERLNLAKHTVYVLLDRQEIESRYIGRRRLVVAESLAAYIDNLPRLPQT